MKTCGTKETALKCIRMLDKAQDMGCRVLLEVRSELRQTYIQVDEKVSWEQSAVRVADVQESRVGVKSVLHERSPALSVPGDGQARPIWRGHGRGAQAFLFPKVPECRAPMPRGISWPCGVMQHVAWKEMLAGCPALCCHAPLTEWRIRAMSCHTGEDDQSRGQNRRHQGATWR